MITETRIVCQNSREIVLPYDARIKEGAKLYINEPNGSVEFSCKEESHHITILDNRPVKHTVVVFAE